MAIVNAERLNRFMNSPNWSDAQYEEAEDVLAGLEGTLADALGTKITLEPCTERVTILGSGQVDTTWPVHSVTALNGVVIPDGGALPAGWSIDNHRLRYQDPATGLPAPNFSLLTGWTYASGTVGRVEGVGAVTVSYMAGLGDVPSLRLLILRKGKTIMENRHEETMIARGLDAQAPPPVTPETFSTDELKPLERYRNLTGWR